MRSSFRMLQQWWQMVMPSKRLTSGAGWVQVLLLRLVFFASAIFGEILFSESCSERVPAEPTSVSPAGGGGFTVAPAPSHTVLPGQVVPAFSRPANFAPG